MLTNCSKDEFEEGIQNSKNKNNISFEQFKSETGLTNFKTTIKINQNLNPNSALLRNADGSYELSDFNINTDIIKRLSLQEKITYTFNVERVVITNTSYFNLIVFYKNNNWEMRVIELKPSEENLLALQNGSTNIFIGTSRLLYQSDIRTDNSAGTIAGCEPVIIIDLHCPGGGPCGNGICDACHTCVTVTQLFDYCMDDPNSFGNGGYTPSTPTSGGGPIGTGTGTSPIPNTGPIVIIPNLENPNFDLDLPKTPCGELDKFTANNSI